jgi:hypothetical protein
VKKALLVAASGLAIAGLATAGAAGTTKGSAPRFGKRVLLTVDKGAGGYEPSVIVDRFNNVVVTAHKQNHSLVVSPDSRSATKVRSMSWIWTSSDHKTFRDMPGKTALMEQNAEFGDEGDIAYDATGHIYFVDTNVVDNSFTRWKATGRGKLALETTRPVGPFGEFVDDRPWIAAHGDGVVMYIGNEGDSGTYPGGQLKSGDSQAYGPGRYTVYMSYDHGDSFDPLGISLNGSGWCRPAADKRKGSKLLYVLCTNDGGSDVVEQTASMYGSKGLLYSYVSRDDGKTWQRYTMGGYDAKDATQSYPSVTVAKDGTVYALYNESKTNSDGYPIDSHLKLFTSKDNGRHWAKRDVTPREGAMRYTWVDVAPNGTLGIAYYYREGGGSPWYLYAGTAKPGKRFAVAKVDSHPVASKDFPTPLGDYFMCAFGPDSKMHVVWTSLNTDLALEGLNSDIYYARQI